MSQYVEKDIRLGQQSLQLARQGLDLQQDALNFNKTMTLTNTALNVFTAIDNYSKQQEIKLWSEGQKELDPILKNGVLKGDIRVDYDENGKPVYSGLDDDTETGRAVKAWKEKYTGRIDTEMGGLKWGNTGRAKETFEKGLLESYYGALNNAISKRYQDTYNLFSSNYQEKIQESVMAADDSAFEAFMQESKSLLPDEVYEQKLAEGKESIRIGRIEAKAISIGETQDMGAVQNFLTDQDLDKTESSLIYSKADKARNEVLKIQSEKLKEKWEDRLAEKYSMSLERLQNEKRLLQNDKGLFENHKSLYNDYMGEIDRLIAGKREASSGSGSGSSNPEVFINNVHRSFGDWAAGRINRTQAIGEMFSVNPPSEAAYNVRDALFVKMLDADDGSHLTSTQFERLTTTLTDWEIDQSVIDGYRENFMSMRGDEFTPQTAKTFVDGVLDKTIAKRMSELSKNPNKGLSTKEENEILIAANTGRLDVVQYPKLGRYGQREEAAYIPGGETLQARATGIARSEIESQITATGWEITGEGIELKGGNQNNNTGQVYHKLKKSGTEETTTVRVNIVDGKRKLEKKTDEGWVSFDGEVKAGRAETVKQFDESLGDDTRNSIRNAMDAAVASSSRGAAATSANPRAVTPGNSRNNYDHATAAIAQFRIKLEEKLGNEAKTEEGKAYIEAKVEELRTRVGGKV